MSLPRLLLVTQDVREIARVIRGALRLEVEVVSLVEPPSGPGQYLLEIEIPNESPVNLLAEPAGPARPDGHPLRVRPTTRVQMAELFALVERLDEPSKTAPPPPNDDPVEEAHGPDATIVEAPSRLPFAGFGAIDSLMPSPPSSGTNIPEPSSMRPAPPSASRVPADPQLGRMLAGKYRIEAALGSGMAATVYRATHIDLRREVAVKILHAQNRGEKQFVKRFKAEALTASKLEHPNVTRIIDFGQEKDGELYLVMELVTGTPLEAALASEGPLRQRRVVDIGIQVCRALQFAHEKGVIHRDIKPENIMLVPDRDDDGTPSDLVKVCDFGLAKLRDAGDDEMTAVGMLCGSPAYMSPEQTRGEVLDARTDLYALGVTLFEALTTALPHEAFSIGELFMKKSTVPPRKLSTLVSVDPLLEDVVMRAMATDPAARHLSARELRAELRAVRDQLASDEDDEAEHATIIGG